jgi:hypothetical protein
LIRKWFLGDILDERELGVWRSGIQRIRQTAIVVRVDGERELFLERAVVAPFAWGVQYLHIPRDGWEAIEAVAAPLGTQDTSSPSPPTPSDRWASAFLQICRVPVVLFFLGFVMFWLVSVGALLTGVPIPDSDLGAGIGFAAGIGAFALHFGSMWVVSRRLHEPMAATMTRLLVGVPHDLRPMGTYRGPIRKIGFAPRKLRASLHVMSAGESLVMTRSHRSLFSRGVAVFPTPRDQMPALLEVISALKKQAPTVEVPDPSWPPESG